MKLAISRLMYGTIVIALVSGMVSCNGSDSTDKAKDSVATAAANAKEKANQP